MLADLLGVSNPHCFPVSGYIVVWKRWDLTVLLFATSPFSGTLGFSAKQAVRHSV